MTDQIRLELTNEAEVRAYFANIAAFGREPSVWLGAVASTVKEQTRRRFASGVSPEGSKWAPVLRGGSPLRDTGTHLMNAISYVVRKDEAFVGVPYAWAKVHQFGATIRVKRAPYLRFKVGRGKSAVWARKKQVRIPARAFFGVNAADQREIIEVLADVLRYSAKGRKRGT